MIDSESFVEALEDRARSFEAEHGSYPEVKLYSDGSGLLHDSEGNCEDFDNLIEFLTHNE